MKTILSALVILAGSASQAAFQVYNQTMISGKTVSFVTLKDGTAKGMDRALFSKLPANQKPDQALLQNQYPLTEQERNAITAEDIKRMTQEEIDQLYIRLESGPIIPGAYNGSVVQNSELAKDIKKSAYTKIAGDFPALGMFAKLFCSNRDPVECLAETIWSGKRIYPQNAEGEYMLRNAIEYATYASVQTLTGNPLNTVGQLFGNITDVLGITKDKVADKVIFPGTNKISAMIFPAHVYCGQSLLDHRRESVIIDYAWGKSFEPYNKDVDILAGPGYLNIRDEVRMIKPGLYLGRAYTNKIFLLNFVLQNSEPVGVAANACFDGKSTR